MFNKKFKSFGKRFACLILVVIIILSLTACNEIRNLFVNDEVYSFSTTNSMELGIVDRNIPELFDGGLTRYPNYANKLKFSEEEKTAISKENERIFDYDSMDENGNLYKGGQLAEIDKLKKHSSANGMYMGDISDTAPAVAKKIRITPAKYGNNMTGLYAPPGEIVKIILNEKDVKRSMRVNIGQCGQRQDSINIPTSKSFSRMPIIKKNMTLKNVENYVGSPLGGAIYIMNEGDGLAPYEITIIGAVEMPHYLLNSTTDSEWERLRSAPGSMFDMETYGGVRLTMPAKYARGLNATEIRKIAEFWDKSAQLANKVSAGGWYQSHPVTLIYDTYVPAGAAVAFVGRDLCVLPIDWASNALNYKSIVTSGQWGNLHEMNHHHQGWGAGNNGEVTNNVINAMIYCHDTNIAASRTENGGLSGWNWVTNAYSSLNNTLKKYNNGQKNQDLSMYVDILHSFGIDKMITMANNSRQNNENSWYKAVCDATGYDMTYFLEEVCGFDLDKELIAEVKAKNLPVFVPIANLYQCARDVISDSGEGQVFTETGKPFYISFGEEKILDFTAYTAVPNGISYEIVNVTAPEYGKLKKKTDEKGNEINGQYLYTPKKGNGNLDSFYVTYSLKNDKDNSMKIEDVTIKISLMQDGSGVQGKIWQNVGWSDIDSAVEDGFEKAAEPIDDVSYSYAGTSDSRQHTITAVEGKIVVPIGGTYDFFIKGDDSVRLYTGFEKNKLSLSAILNEKTNVYSRDIEGSFFTVKMETGKPLYFKLYVKNDTGKGFSRIGFSDISQIEGATPMSDGGGGIDSGAELPIVDVPASYVYRKDADHNVPGRADFQSDRKYARLLKASGAVYLNTDTMSVTSPTAMYDNRDNMGNITDGNENTFCHTKPGSMPAEFIFDLKSVKTFNTLSLTFIKNSNRGRIKDYSLFFASSPLEFADKLADVTGIFANTFRVNSVFNKVSARYIKLVANSAYDSNGQKFVAISTVNLGEGISGADIAPESCSDIIYKGNWNVNTYGTFLNGAIFETKKGSFEVSFHGTDFALFAKKSNIYSVADIRIDGGKWQTIDFYSDTELYNQAIFVAADLEDGYHKVELKAKGLINVDYLAIKPTVPPQAQKMALTWRILIILAIIAVCASIGVGSYYVTKYFKEKDIDDNSDDTSPKDSMKAKNIKDDIVNEKNITETKPIKKKSIGGAQKHTVEKSTELNTDITNNTKDIKIRATAVKKTDAQMRSQNNAVNISDRTYENNDDKGQNSIQAQTKNNRRKTNENVNLNQSNTKKHENIQQKTLEKTKTKNKD